MDQKETGYSFRNYKDLLLVGGGDHRTGKKGGGYAQLHRLAEKAYPDPPWPMPGHPGLHEPG